MIKYSGKFYFILFLLAITSKGYTQPKDPFAPPPTIQPFDKTSTKGKQKDNPPIAPIQLKNSYKDFLPNYEPGRDRHLHLIDHCNKIVKFIDQFNKKIESIYIKGFADGIPNKKSDKALANSRAEIYRKLLTESLKNKGYFPMVKFILDSYDEPDYGNIGGKFRKVEITITYK